MKDNAAVRFVLVFFGKILAAFFSFLVVLSLVTGEFPPPVGRLRRQVNQILEASNKGVSIISNQDRLKAQEFGLGEVDGLDEGGAPKQPLFSRAKILEESVQTDRRSQEQILSEIRLIRLKLQSLEVDLRAQNQRVESLERHQDNR
jgi:hypothetical protein